MFVEMIVYVLDAPISIQNVGTEMTKRFSGRLLQINDKKVVIIEPRDRF
jgi:hypothetical protein